MARSGPQGKGPTFADIKQAEDSLYQILDSTDQSDRVALLKKRVALTVAHRAMFMRLVEGDCYDFFVREIKPVDEALKALEQTPEEIKQIGEAVGRIASYHDGRERIETILRKTKSYTGE